jgi:hypothetical protein
MSPPLPDAAASSPLSSPDSFVTADASPQNLQDVIVTDTSTPDDDVTKVEFRKARPLPHELKQHCQIYLEENLHMLALRMLGRLQSSSSVAPSNWACRPRGGSKSVYCPPPNQLAFLGTLAVHPDLTTRPREEHWTDVSSASLVYLRSLLRTVGPINARFQDAFRFGHAPRQSRGGTPSGDGSDGGYDSGDETHLYGRYGKHSVWRRGQDFFNVVGWAFNCSVLYPNRWEYWRQWLEFIFDVLEEDIYERIKMDEQEHARGGIQKGNCRYPLLAESMLAGYVKQRNGRTGGVKWIIRVIFADGQDSSASLFQEVWDKEHKGVTKTVALKKRKRKINIEKGDFGGLLDDDSVYSSQTSEPATPQKRRTVLTMHESPALAASYIESISLRQRLFSMLSSLCHYLPTPPIDLPDLYETYETYTRNLPLSLFTAFVDSTTSSLLCESQISTLQDILLNFMPATAVNPAKVNAARYDVNGTSPEIIERCFLPYAANTIAAEDNAKVSILLEELMKLVWIIGSEPFSENLYAAVIKGINAREAKIKKKVPGVRARRNGPVQEDTDSQARLLLAESSKRLRQLAELIANEAKEERTGRVKKEGAGTVDEMGEGKYRSKPALKRFISTHFQSDIAEASYMTARSS